MNVELKHTLVVSRKSSWFRFYVWLWEANQSETTFCKLFWGYVFVLPGLFVRGCFAIADGLVKLEKKRRAKRKPKITMKIEVASESSGEPPPTIMQALLSRIETYTAKAALAMKAGWNAINMGGRLTLILSRMLVACGVLLGMGVVGGVVLAFAEFPVVQLIGLTLIGAAICSVLLMGFIYAMDRMGVWETVGTGASYGGRGIAKGAITFWDAMVAGYVAVKSSTCPKIEVRD